MTATRTPYGALPDHCFWSRSHRGRTAAEIDPVVRGAFRISPATRIATAGSCFAQHIARHLREAGYTYLVTERAHPLISEPVARDWGYGVFTARFGNLYTARQLLQLVQRAYGDFAPVEDVWQAPDGSLIDPFRPNIQPGGFADRAEYDAARAAHFAAVREMVETCEVFVFTFGLTEAWVSREDGAVFPLAPGVAGGDFDPGRHAFANFTAAEVAADFRAFAGLLRARNPGAKILMTVSPVPLIATARADESVIAATAYSKAALRVAAEELRATLPDCAYFPSYEIITGAHARGAYFAEDLREVRPEGVAHVMRLFMEHYTEGAAPPRAKRRAATEADSFAEQVQGALDVICDEELIDRPRRRSGARTGAAPAPAPGGGGGGRLGARTAAGRGPAA